jgi:nucleoside-triphosphatase
MGIKARIAVTGRPGVGKTTLIRRVVEQLPVSVGGMITQEIRKCGVRVGFAVIDIATGQEGILAHLHQQKGPKVGRYRVNLQDLEQIGIEAIKCATRASDLVVIDEIAPMELCSSAFLPTVEVALASEKALLISTHGRVDHPLIHRIRQELELFRVKVSNRDSLVETIAQRFAADLFTH